MSGMIYLNDDQAEAVFNLLDAYLRTESADDDDLLRLAEVRAKANRLW